MTTLDPALALGTVQWGMAYGIANRTGRATDQDVARMLELARAAGVDTLDTAQAYGDAEAVVGRALSREHRWRIVTKIDPGICAPGDTAQTIAAATSRSLETSRVHLRRHILDDVLLHRPEHRMASGGAAWRVLRASREAGDVTRIGVSATSPDTAMAALADDEVEVMQVATSLLDRRLVARGFFEGAEARGVEVHVRSAFLQGVAFMDSAELPDHLAALAPALAEIDAWAAAHGTERATTFLAYALTLPVSRVVIGCERPAQLEANLAALGRARGLATGVRELAAALPALPDAVLDPSQWSG